MPLAYAMIHEECGLFGVSFPDFPGVVASAKNAEEALRKSTEALTFHVAGIAEDGDIVPVPRALTELRDDPAWIEDAGGAVVALVSFDLPMKSVRVNISIDEALLSAVDQAAHAAGQSRSAFLSEAARLRMRAT